MGRPFVPTLNGPRDSTSSDFSIFHCELSFAVCGLTALPQNYLCFQDRGEKIITFLISLDSPWALISLEEDLLDKMLSHKMIDQQNRK